MFDRDKFSRAVCLTGLTKAEFAFVIGVTRMTVYEWLHRGGEPQHPVLQTYVDRACDALLLAVEKGVLPLSAAFSKESRKAKVHAMKRVLLRADNV